MPDLAATIATIAADMASVTDRGKVADYIPELAGVPLGKFGIAVCTADGAEHIAGDADEPFSIQSVSKLFTLKLALDIQGDALWTRVGREPSGSAFNSIVQLEAERGIPRNPFINAGALIVADVIAEAHDDDRGAIGAILRFLRELAGTRGNPDETIQIDPRVAYSEAATGFRNAALANYMKSFGNLRRPVDEVLQTYFHQCAIAMSCRQLARATRFLSAGGEADGTAIVTPERARRIAALMLTCGHYDASGDFAFRVGLPAKSGVGGGIVAVVPGRASVAVWSPGLGAQGNSVLATLALERLAGAMGWSVFTPEGG
ncbi:glutaminase [Glacieibacterium frigidum]|uniref:Glutaminase n=1 Tax=Glacieibacterium frigidum TaxID=2593303 RepID=A0A552UIM3_9SPHN|nr:glutaminase [Glacieibacterium frigidum]TRW18072.1 glutaminase [Glacieibacterium frigidum]